MPEYYREYFNPMLHPFIYKFINLEMEKVKEENGWRKEVFVCNGRAIDTLITGFFNRISEEDQRHMQSQGWVP